jgi:hypothetical protein
MRVRWYWYLIVLTGVPMLLVGGTVLPPGATAGLRTPSLSLGGLPVCLVGAGGDWPSLRSGSGDPGLGVGYQVRPVRAGGVAGRVDSVRDRGDRIWVGRAVQGEPEPRVFTAVELGPAGA